MKTKITIAAVAILIVIGLMAIAFGAGRASRPKRVTQDIVVYQTNTVPVEVIHTNTTEVAQTITNTTTVSVTAVTVTNTINMTVTNVVTETNVITLTNTVAAPSTGTGSTNAQIGVVQQAIPLPPGPSFNTNGVVDGLPCLFINKGRKSLTCYVQGGGGRVTLNLAPGTRTFNLLPGKYGYEWAFDKGPNLAGGEFSVAKEATHFVDGHGACHGGVEFREE